MNKETIDKIITIVDLEFDVLLFNAIADEYEIGLIYNRIRKKLENLE